MSNEFIVKNGLIVGGNVVTSGTITINGALAATQSWVISQAYLTSASLSGYATQSYVTSAIASLVDSAPAALDTLKELATALGNDASFATTVTNSIASKQAQLNGTGLVRMSGTTVSYDNTTYLISNFGNIEGEHGYGYPSSDGWYKIAEVVLNGACQSYNLWGEYRDTGYFDNSHYRIHITARAECDFPSNNESHAINVNIYGSSTNETYFTNNVRVILTSSSSNYRKYELQYYRATWDTGSWRLQTLGWTTYATSQTAGTSTGTPRVYYISKFVADNIYAANKISIGTSYSGFAANIAGTTYIIGASAWVNDAYGYVNASSPGTGFFPYSDGNSVIASSNTTRLFVNGSTGNIGIGTSSPSTKLEVNGGTGLASGNIARFTLGGAGGGTRGLTMYSDGSQFKLQVSDNVGGIGSWAFLNLNPDGGNVGIGTTAPDEKLQVAGNIKIQNETGLITDYGPLVGRYNTSQVYVGTGGNYSIVKIGRADGGALNVLSGGDVGIGSTTTSGYKLYVNGSTWINGGTNFTDGVSIFRTQSGGAEVMRVASNSNVGIGTTSPNYKLDVNGSINIYTGNSLRWGSGDAEIINSGYNLLFKTYNGSALAEAMRINSAGKVSIGTTDTNSDKSDFTVYTGGNTSIALAGNLFRVGEGDINWDIALRSNGFLETYAQPLYLRTITGSQPVVIGPNGTNTVEFYPDYTLFNGLNLSISRINAAHAANYFRGDSSHLVIGTGGTLYLNYANTSGNTYIFGNTYINSNVVWHAGNLTNLNQLTNGPGYITGYTETDTLQSVTSRGATTNNRLEFQYSVDRYSQAWRNTSTGAYWWVTTDSDKLGLHLNGDGDKFYFGNNGDFYSTANGWLSSALAAKQNASTAINTSNIGSQSVSYANSAGEAGQVTNQTGQLLRFDNRIISPSETTAGYLQFGFTSWTNDNNAPYADYLHLRSYTDASGGNDNLVMFLKSGIGMRIYQQSWGTTAPYSSYVDVWTTGNFTQSNVNNWNTAYGWGNHASAGYLTSVTAHTQAWSTITSTPTTISGYGITNAYTDAQIQNFFNGANSISGYNKSNWDTAYSWGNHASASYLTSFTETDTLASVTGRGNTTNSDIIVNGVTTIQNGGYLKFIAGSVGTTGFTVFNAAQNGYLSNRITTSDHVRGWGWELTDSLPITASPGVFFRVGYNGNPSFLTSGNFGIGTSSPSEKLHVSGAAIFDGGAGNSSTDAVVYITKSTNDDWGLYVNNAGLDYGMYTRTSPSANYAFALHNGTTWTTRITGNGNFISNEKLAISSTDSWLRLNQNNDFGQGVYTPGVMRADGGFNVSGNTVWHAANDGSGSGLDADLLDGQNSTEFLRLLSGGAEASLDSYTDNGVRSVSFAGHSQHLLSWNAGGSTGTVQQLFHYGTPNNGWRIRNKTDNSSWSDWGYVVMASSNQGLISGTIATQSWVGSQSYATTSYVTTQINNLINGAPGVLDTLDELAAALGDDANFATTVTNSIAGKVSKSGDTMTGNLTLAGGTNILFTGGSHAIAGNNTGYLHFYDYTNVYFNNQLVIRGGIQNDGGNVLIDDNLNVNGELAFPDGAGAYSNIIRSAPYPSEGYPSGLNFWMEYRAKGGHHFILNTDGGVGAGLASMDDFVIWQGAIDGNRLLEVSNIGNLWIAGALTESSSLKLKENVETSEGNLEKVVNLRPVTYNKIGSQTTELGLIAEEVAEVYPEFVQYDENGEPIGVHYSRLTAALIGAVKELNEQLQELKRNK